MKIFLRSFLFFALILSICINISIAKGSQSAADRLNNRKRGQCEETECAHIHYLENTNCVNKCLSRNCYKEVYKDNELEDGEINQSLERSFRNCLRSETIRNRRSNK
jgi:hypothetical protein